MSDSKWADLRPRVVSGLTMVAIGAICILWGGVAFQLMVALACGLMVWELVGMLNPGRRDLQLQLAGLSGLALFIAHWLPMVLALPLLCAPLGFGYRQMTKERDPFAIYAALILLAGYGLLCLRDGAGMVWVLWLVVAVVITDVAGYFAGRFFGGPKFWPRYSPKKTWSGTIGGWAGAALVGLIFIVPLGGGIGLILLSVAVSLVSQLGDIAESALKRHAGVKDSSDLIPGHGGLMDRFDGLLTAAVFLLVSGIVFGLPPGLT